MNTMLNFVDKLYGDTKMLTIVYVIGAVALLVFIVLLVISLRKPKIKKKVEKNETEKDAVSVNTDIKVENTEANHTEANKADTELKNVPLSNTETNNETSNVLSQALSNIEIQSITKDNNVEEEKVDESKLGADIPNVDDYVDSIVKKTYEKNEQFSSVYNTTNIKLDDVADKLNIDKDVQEVILPDTEIPNENVVENTETKKEEKVEVPTSEETKTETTVTPNNLDLLKNKLEEKKNELSETTTINQEDLKAKLAGLSKIDDVKEQPSKTEEAVSPEDLLKKLNSMKEN